MESFGNMARPYLIEQMERLVWLTLFSIVDGQDPETLIAALIICFEEAAKEVLEKDESVNAWFRSLSGGMPHPLFHIRFFFTTIRYRK